jgi:NADPH:quinone reductase-like Zn-dependent oxidoreductase
VSKHVAFTFSQWLRLTIDLRNSHTIGLGTQEPHHGGYQLYTVVPEILVCPVPDDLPLQRAAVLPLAISTAAAGLYQKTHLGLPYPKLAPKKIGKTILVWGGSSSVGSAAIQLASSSGLIVAAVAPTQHHGYAKNLGAAYVFDYKKDNVVEDIIAALKMAGTEIAGAYDAIAHEETVKACAQVVSQLGGGKVVSTLPPPEEGLPDNVQAVGRGLFSELSALK